MNKLLISILIFLYIDFSVLNAQLLTKNQVSAIEASISQEMKTSGTPGVVLAIINNNKVVYEKGFGLANIQTKVKMTDTTICQIASVTKIFTAITLLTELKNAHINFYDSIGKVIKGLSPKLSSLTFHQLLSHTSGMIDYTNEYDNKGVFDFFKNIGDTILFIESGKVFSDSNTGYALIGLAIEQLTGKSYTTAVEDAIIKPLQLKNTTFDFHNVACKSFSSGHYYDYRKKILIPYISHFEMPLLQAAGGIFSNIQDLERLATCLMNKGILEGKQVIDSCIIEQMSFPHSKNFTASAPSYFLSYPNNAYGYGLLMFDYGSLRFIGHCGGGAQMTFLLYEPKAKFAMIIISNLGSDMLTTSFKKIWEVVLKEKEIIHIDKNFDKNEWNEITGKYIQPSIDKMNKNFVEILEKDKKLYINYNGTENIELEQIGQMIYRYSTPYSRFPIEISFYWNESDKVAYLRNFWRTWMKIE